MKKNKDKNLFELPNKEQERIMRNAVRKANKEQQDLVKRYDQQYGKTSPVGGC